MTEKPASVIKWAMEIAEELPEKYQVAAFAELLRHAFGSVSDSAEPGRAAHPRVPVSAPSDDHGLQAPVCDLPNDFVVADQGTRDQQTVWAVMKLCQNGEEATPQSVRQAVEINLCVKPESVSNTRRRLRRLAPRYLQRRDSEDGRGYAYTPTAKAPEVFGGLAEV